jgi:hypothetical protein
MPISASGMMARQMQRGLQTILILGLAMAGFGCGGGDTGSHSVNASDYDRACSQDSDCVAVYSGKIGCCGDAPNSAIAQDNYSQYQSDYSSRHPVCIPAPPCAPLSYTTTVACVNEVCQLTSASLP